MSKRLLARRPLRVPKRVPEPKQVRRPGQAPKRHQRPKPEPQPNQSPNPLLHPASPRASHSARPRPTQPPPPPAPPNPARPPSRKRHRRGRRRRYDRRRHLHRFALRRRRRLGQRRDMLLLGRFHGRAIAAGRIDLQEMVDQIEKAFIEDARRNRLARRFHERVVARADRQRQRAEHAQADARRRIRLLQRIAVLHRIHVRDARRAVGVRVRAHDVKLDHDVHVVVRLEVLAAVDRIVARRRHHVTLAQQRAPRGLAGRLGLRMERMRIRAARRVELFLLIDRLGRRRARGQHGGGRERARNGGQAKSVVHGVFQRARRVAATAGEREVARRRCAHGARGNLVWPGRHYSFV